MSESGRVNREILSLLLQVAWADEEVGAKEAAQIIRRAQMLGVDSGTLDSLEACLRGEKTLPPPDMGFLRAHRETALEAVRALVAADSVVSDEEDSLLAQIDELLS